MLTQRLRLHLAFTGHALLLDHGNGLDDDDDGPWDIVCDTTGEANCDTPTSFMASTSCCTTAGGLSTVLTDLQRGLSRAVACVYDGSVNQPAGGGDGDSGDVVSDQRVDASADTDDPESDLAHFEIRVDGGAAAETAFIHHLSGSIPLVDSNIVYKYVSFIDSDGNAATGGMPDALGYDTEFAGAEIVTEVEVEVQTIIITRTLREAQKERKLQVFYTVDCKWWKYDGSTFQEQANCDARLIDVIGDGDSPDGDFTGLIAQAAEIVISNGDRGPLNPDNVQVQCITMQDDDVKDRFPEELDGSVTFRPRPPIFPHCNVLPGTAAPGDIVTIASERLWENSPLKVILGDLKVGEGETDNDGKSFIDVRIPIFSTPGPRLVTVGIVGTALTADCIVEVEPGPKLALVDEIASNLPGTQHTVTAWVRDDNYLPVGGEEVDFEILAGPNAGVSGICNPISCVSGPDGLVRFTYSSGGSIGVDTLQASTSNEDSNTVFKLWDNDCNENGIADTCDEDCAGFDGICQLLVPKYTCGTGLAGNCCAQAGELMPRFCTNVSPHGGQDPGCTYDYPICVNEDGGELSASVGGVFCAPCVNSFQADHVADFGCPPDKPMCVCNGEAPDLMIAGNECLPFPYTCINNAPHGGQDYLCPHEAPICVGEGGIPIDDECYGDECVVCVNSQQSDSVADYGCNSNQPRCVIAETSESPDLSMPGDKCEAAPGSSGLCEYCWPGSPGSDCKSAFGVCYPLVYGACPSHTWRCH